jgi:hypothetical protein
MIDTWVLGAQHSLYEQRMLRHRKDMRSVGLSIPACDARKTMCDILHLDVEGRGVKQIETASGQHSLPCPSR